MIVNEKTRKIDYKKWSQGELIKEIQKLEKRKKYGLIWDEERTKEVFEEETQEKLPVLKDVTKNGITDITKPNNILIEGDNYHALSVLNYTHRHKIDLIHIDPPYNTGKNDFRYNDKWINEEDGYRHSKWINFMNKRLRLAKNLLKCDGLIVVHIDEHEQSNLSILMNDIFLAKNFLGTIVWNKKNPKGDSKGIAYQHESILVFAKNKEEFLKQHKLERSKQNANIILKKAKKLFVKLNKIDYPLELKEIISKYEIPKECVSKYKQKITMNEIRYEFKEWLKKQEFSNGEKAYSKMSEVGRVYQTVSMAWPNKKKAPDNYCVSLIHPITGKKCPVPERGWRYNSNTMKKLLKQNLIEFGNDETVQPRQKYFLENNMFENIPSIVNFGGSDDKLLSNLELNFQNPKPTKLICMLLDYFLKKNGVVLDFMVGSGTLGHAVLELNKNDGGNRKFIVCTNNENKICTDVCYPRLKKVIKGYKNLKNEKIDGLGGNLKYFKTSFVDSEPTNQNKKIMVEQSTEMLCLKEDCFELIKEGKQFKIFKNYENKYLGIIYYYDGIEPFKKEISKLGTKINTYVFSFIDEVDEKEFENLRSLVTLKPIPFAILNVYRRIFAYVQTKKLPRKTRK